MHRFEFTFCDEVSTGTFIWVHYGVFQNVNKNSYFFSLKKAARMHGNLKFHDYILLAEQYMWSRQGPTKIPSELVEMGSPTGARSSECKVSGKMFEVGMWSRKALHPDQAGCKFWTSSGPEILRPLPAGGMTCGAECGPETPSGRVVGWNSAKLKTRSRTLPFC